MKLTNFILFSFIIVTTVSAQPGIVDSFKNKFNTSKADTSRVNLLIAWAEYYNEDESDSVVMLSQQGLDLARKLHYSKGEVRCLVNMGNGYYGLGNYVKAVQVFQQAMTLSNEIDYQEGNMRAFGFYTLTYYLQGDFRRELSYHLHVEQQARKLNNLAFIIMALGQAGKAYVELGILDSATFYLNKTYLLLKQVQFNHPKAALFVTQIGVLSRIQNQKALALSYLRQAIPICMATNAKGRLTTIYLSIADIYKSDKQMDSALYYAKKAFLTAHENTFKFQNIARSGFWLSQIYDTMHNYRESMYYAKLATQASDSLLNQDKVNQITNMIFNEQLQQQQLKAAEDRYRNQIKFYASLAALVFFLIVGLTLYRNNKQNRQAKIKIEKAYEELKTTQSQLIQKEKMASLGELTAGIAHEIQNPLNFVNNFSEVNKELIEEMKTEIDKGNLDDVKSIANDIQDNEQKINHHGKRADAIVKGMLLHSRASNAVKEPADINKLTDEYLRLAYHGLRAKDKSFNVTLKTEFDQGLGHINIISQEIGRVILNLINNAFYAVNEKRRQGQENFDPTVAVSTKKVNGKVEIRIKDNGNGIPAKVIDKIFQPFFTTKPTGQGTGLGLSLSYDIIKAHGGEITATSIEKEGTSFIISLPGNHL